MFIRDRKQSIEDKFIDILEKIKIRTLYIYQSSFIHFYRLQIIILFTWNCYTYSYSLTIKKYTQVQKYIYTSWAAYYLLDAGFSLVTINSMGGPITQLKMTARAPTMWVGVIGCPLLWGESLIWRLVVVAICCLARRSPRAKIPDMI